MFSTNKINHDLVYMVIMYALLKIEYTENTSGINEIFLKTAFEVTEWWEQS